MTLVVLTLLLAAAPTEPPLKLAMPGLRCVNLDAESCTFFGDYFAQQLSSRSGVRVTTQTEIATLLGFERQKQLLGCEAESSCIAELAGGLGVDGIVVGNLAKIADEYVINLRLLSAKDASPIASDARRVQGEKRVLDALSATAAAMAAQLPNAKGRAPLPAPPPTAPISEGTPLLGGPQVWGTAVAGLVAGGVGAGFLIAAQGVRTDLHSPPATRSQTDLNQLIGRGELYQNLGVGLAIGGGALIAVAGGLFALNQTQAPAVSFGFSVAPDGALIRLRGTLP